MTEPNGTASGEVPESQPSGPDLAERIVAAWVDQSIDNIGKGERPGNLVATIRESLAPIREALEEGLQESRQTYSDTRRAALLHYCIQGALRLLRGEELSGNRGVGGGE